MRSDPTEGDKAASDTITIGSAAFPENEIIAEIYAQALEAKGVKVTKKLNIGAREAYIKALKNGEIDLLPEYSGNLLSYLDPKATATSAERRSRTRSTTPCPRASRCSTPRRLRTRTRSTSRRTSRPRTTSRRSQISRTSRVSSSAPTRSSRSAPYGIPGLEKVYGITGIKFVPIRDGGGPKTLEGADRR